MERLQETKSRIDNIDSVISDVVEKNKQVLLSLNRDQMLLGRNSEGELFTPDYLNDPYFKTTAQAQSYAAKKYRLEGEHKARIENILNYPDKPRNTPNLIVTGPFQDSMVIETTGDSFTIDSFYIDTPDIESKYKFKVFGLAPLSVEYFWKNYLLLALRAYLGFK